MKAFGLHPGRGKNQFQTLKVCFYSKTYNVVNVEGAEPSSGDTNEGEAGADKVEKTYGCGVGYPEISEK